MAIGRWSILTAVLTDGLPALEAACAEAIAHGVRSADVVLNIYRASLMSRLPAALSNGLAAPLSLLASVEAEQLPR